MRLNASEITALARRIFSYLGASPENATIMAGIVARAELAGTHSHGLMRLPDYAASIRVGWLDPAAEPRIEEHGAVMRADGRNGFTQVATARAAARLAELARSQGMALLAVRNAHHVGALWTDVEPLAEQGFVVASFVNSRPLIAPYGARARRIGSNAMSFGFPDGKGGAVVWDQASSSMSFGDVRRHANQGRLLPEGTGLDSEGRPTNDPQALIAGGALLPFSGARGASIAMMVEVMAASVAGGSFGFEDRSFGFPGAASSNAGQLLLVLNPARISGHDPLPRLRAFLRYLRQDPEIRLPGDRRRASRIHSMTNGVELSAEDLTLLETLTHE